MLHRLSIQNRSPRELRQLASERRGLASSKEGRLKALLIMEAELLEFHAGMRIWLEHTAPLDPGDLQVVQEQTQATAQLSLARLFLAALSRRMALPAADQHALLSVAQLRHFAKGETIVDEGEQAGSFRMLCHGAARATRTLENGSQQIVSVFLPGDTLNPGDLILGRSRTAISAFMPALVLSVSAAELRLFMEQRPALTRALWRETAFQAAIQREWLIGVGRKTAESRLAHFLCEVTCRMQVGEQVCNAIELPLTQRDLADILGLSCVHVNRVLQHLRSRKLVDLSKGQLIIWNREGLYGVAEFDPEYLGFSDAAQRGDRGAS
jgi:CRP-like cAMP-binding protein